VRTKLGTRSQENKQLQAMNESLRDEITGWSNEADLFRAEKSLCEQDDAGLNQQNKEFATKIAKFEDGNAVQEERIRVLDEQARIATEQNEQFKTGVESMEKEVEESLKEVEKSLKELNDYKQRVRALGNEC
jgi:chromosome segregation ATPase